MARPSFDRKQSGTGRKVLVTGGTGFIGANVVRLLVARGDRVTCTVRASSPGLGLAGLQVKRVRLDLGDRHAVEKALRGIDEVYHLAGVFDPSPEGADLMHRVHVDVAQTLCDASLTVGVRRLLYCSSSVTVGFGPRDAPGDEDTPLPDLDDFYGRGTALRGYHDSKLAGEQLVASYVPRGLETVTVNPDYVIGPWDIKPTSGALIVAMAKRWIPFHPAGGKCFIDGVDCAQGHLLAMEKGTAGRRYLLGSHNLSYAEFMGIVAKVVGRRPPLGPIPDKANRVLGRVGRVLNRVDTHRFAGLDPMVLRSMAEQRYRTGQRSWDELGVPRRSIEHAVQSAYEWFVKQRYV